MLKLRKILLCDYIYIILLIIVVLVSIIRLNIKPKLYYDNTNIITGIITNIIQKDNKYSLTIKGKEKVLGTFYSNKIINLNIGDKVEIVGEIYKPNSNTNKNTFNYKKYLNNKNIYHLINIASINKIKSNRNILYKIKTIILKRINNNKYLSTFILGDKSYLSNEVKYSYQENGISHLFAISGMHITLLSSILLKILNKFHLDEYKIYKIIVLFLLLYLLLVGLSPSILRGVLFFIIFSFNNIYYFYIKKINLFILVLSISLLINPKYIFDISFQYSYLISFTLLIMSNYLTSNNYFISLLKVSLLSNIVSLPITLYNSYQINLLSPIYNLLYVPLISIIIFPLSLITVIFPILIPIYNKLTIIMEYISISLSKINIGKLIFIKTNILIYFIYLILIFISIYFITKKKYISTLILVILLFIHYLIPYFNANTYINVIDVGQGDSILIHNNHKNILLDTGGIRNQNNSIALNTTIPILKSNGINKIDYLILSHGDYDHMGESINIINNYKVKEVIFNCGEYNDLEKELIKVLKKKKINYYQCLSELILNKNSLYFLDTKDYNDENDNSNVIYMELDNYKFLFMGDAGVTTEQEILKEYDLPKIDVLKVGHHGSKTSSSEEFIDTIDPKYSIISVGKDNKFGHPNKEVLDNLKNSKIYRTDQDGSIMFKIKNNKLRIETCSP